MNYKIFATKDNSQGQLNGNINTLTTLIQLKAGDGANFPVIYRGNADSVGTVTTLNKAGIGASGISVGDFIENLTDGSQAFVVSVSANSVETTTLQGGSDNTWDNNDEYAVNRFIITLNARDGDGNVIKSEKVLIGNRSTDILTADTRGYDGDVAQSFEQDDFVNIFVVSRTIKEIGKAFAETMERLDNKATIEYVNGALANRNWKQSVRVTTTVAGTLATDFEDGDTVDGVVLATGDRILIKNQATGSENGIYTVNATGAPTRAVDFDASAEATSAMVAVEEGTASANLVFLCTDIDPVIGVDNITFVEFGSTLVFASQAEAEEGTNNAKSMTPLRVKQSIEYNAGLFGGDGSDGDLSISAGTTTLNALGAKVLIRNYNSISITGTATLTISNPHPTGTILILRSRGDVIMTSSSVNINLKGKGAQALTFPLNQNPIAGSALYNEKVTDSARLQYDDASKYSVSDFVLYSRIINLRCGSSGGGSRSNAGGGSIDANGGEIAPAETLNGLPAEGNGAGGSGARGSSFSDDFNGGHGGGCLIVECRRSLNFTGSIDLSGDDGVNATTNRYGGGGGSCGMALIMYNELTSDAGAIIAEGGDGGDNATLTGGLGGATSTNSYKIIKNEIFT